MEVEIDLHGVTYILQKMNGNVVSMADAWRTTGATVWYKANCDLSQFVMMKYTCNRIKDNAPVLSMVTHLSYDLFWLKVFYVWQHYG